MATSEVLIELKVVMAAANGSGVKVVVMEENREDQVDEMDQDRGRVVAGQYELVRTIFTYLPWKDLETAAKVFSTWRFLLLKYCPGLQTVERGLCHLCEREAEVQQCEVTPLNTLSFLISMLVVASTGKGKKQT